MTTNNKETHLNSMTDQRKVESELSTDIIKNILSRRSLLKRVKTELNRKLKSPGDTMTKNSRNLYKY